MSIIFFIDFLNNENRASATLQSMYFEIREIELKT
jgi:hypothetical protein